MLCRTKGVNKVCKMFLEPMENRSGKYWHWPEATSPSRSTTAKSSVSTKAKQEVLLNLRRLLLVLSSALPVVKLPRQSSQSCLCCEKERHLPTELFNRSNPSRSKVLCRSKTVGGRGMYWSSHMSTAGGDNAGLKEVI